MNVLGRRAINFDWTSTSDIQDGAVCYADILAYMGITYKTR